jgi:hypothetical protein
MKQNVFMKLFYKLHYYIYMKKNQKGDVLKLYSKNKYYLDLNIENLPQEVALHNGKILLDILSEINDLKFNFTINNIEWLGTQLYLFLSIKKKINRYSIQLDDLTIFINWINGASTDIFEKPFIDLFKNMD